MFSQDLLKTSRKFLKNASRFMDIAYITCKHIFCMTCMKSFLPLTRKPVILCLSQMMVRSLHDTAVSEQTQLNERHTGNDHEQAHFSGSGYGVVSSHTASPAGGERIP